MFPFLFAHSSLFYIPDMITSSAAAGGFSTGSSASSGTCSSRRSSSRRRPCSRSDSPYFCSRPSRWWRCTFAHRPNSNFGWHSWQHYFCWYLQCSTRSLSLFSAPLATAATGCPIRIIITCRGRSCSAWSALSLSISPAFCCSSMENISERRLRPIIRASRCSHSLRDPHRTVIMVPRSRRSLRLDGLASLSWQQSITCVMLNTQHGNVECGKFRQIETFLSLWTW